MRASRAAVSVSRVCRALSCSQGSRRETRQVSARVWWQVLAGWLYKYAGSIKGTMYECMLYTHGVQAPPGARVQERGLRDAASVPLHQNRCGLYVFCQSCRPVNRLYLPTLCGPVGSVRGQQACVRRGLAAQVLGEHIRDLCAAPLFARTGCMGMGGWGACSSAKHTRSADAWLAASCMPDMCAAWTAHMLVPGPSSMLCRGTLLLVCVAPLPRACPVTRRSADRPLAEPVVGSRCASSPPP